MERVAEGPIEVRLRTNLSSVKPKARIDCSNIDSDERIDIYANSDMKPVMSLGSENDEFFEIVEKMQAVFGDFCNLWKRLGFEKRNSSFC